MAHIEVYPIWIYIDNVNEHWSDINHISILTICGVRHSNDPYAVFVGGHYFFFFFFRKLEDSIWWRNFFLWTFLHMDVNGPSRWTLWIQGIPGPYTFLMDGSGRPQITYYNEGWTARKNKCIRSQYPRHDSMDLRFFFLRVLRKVHQMPRT